MLFRANIRSWFGLMLVLLILNCSGNSNLPEVSLNVPANASLLQSLRAALPQFEQRQQIRVKLIPFTGQEKLYAMLAAGQPPDIFYTNTVVRDRLAAEGRLLDLRNVASGDSLVARLRPQFIARGTAPDSGWYQFCDWTFTYGVYFNKTLFDQAQVAYPDSAWDWDGLLARARQLTRDFDGDGKTDQDGIFIARHFASALEQMNGAEYPPAALFFEFPAAAVAAQQAYLDLFFKEKVMPEPGFTQAQGMQFSQMLNQGKVAMIVEAVPNLDFIHALQVDWDVAPLPRMGNQPPRYFRAASGGLSVSATCAHPQAAWKIIKWLVTQSEYNSPSPILKDVDFVAGYEAKYPALKNTHFRQVWELSERFDGGDTRDFVRYSSWTSSAILEKFAPKMDLLYSGKISLAEIVASTDEINQHVFLELGEQLRNPAIRPAFRAQIQQASKQKMLP